MGLFHNWGTFRGGKDGPCYAIAEPQPIKKTEGWRPFASVASRPPEANRGQLHIRLRKARKPDTPVLLVIGSQRFRLVAGRTDAWAPDPATDAQIVRAMRKGGAMQVYAQAQTGGRYSDSYPLRGAATAIDAAIIGCARR